MGRVVFYDAFKGDFGGNEPFLNNHKGIWYSTEGYTELQIYFSGYGGESEKYLLRDQFRDARLWMEDNLEGEIIIKYRDRTSSGSLSASAYFQHETDAMAFKLKWLK
jgi:hypothetical protein